MRYISRNCIQPEAVLARPVLGAKGEVLLRSGVRMTEVYIRRMSELGIAGAYVDDPLSEDLDIVNALNDDLRSKAVRSVSATFAAAAKKEENIRQAGEELFGFAEKIIDEVLSHGDVILNMIDMKTYDSYTFFHSVNVAVVSIIIGMEYGLNRRRLIDLAYAGLLHDIGKVLIVPEIINKHGSLTREEFEIVKRHPRDGCEYANAHFPTLGSADALRGIRDHHERVSGCGYPDAKVGGNISLLGKILAVADVYDALISDRPYRKGVFPVEVMEYLQGNCETFFDIELVQIFARKVALFPAGTTVLLSNGCTALVMQNYENLTQRPLIKVFMEDDMAVDPYMVDLSKGTFDVTIVAQVDV